MEGFGSHPKKDKFSGFTILQRTSSLSLLSLSFFKSGIVYYYTRPVNMEKKENFFNQDV